MAISSAPTSTTSCSFPASPRLPNPSPYGPRSLSSTSGSC
jgi:hypothetical protein